MKITTLRRSVVFALFTFLSIAMYGQGSTSARITGSVFDTDDPLIGATILAVHNPTGFSYGTATNEAGLFTLNNVNVGGPYTITISYTGYQTQTLEGINLGLGQTESFNIALAEGSVSLDEVIVTAGGLFDGNRTGSETKVSEEAIATLPTADRGLNDYLRLTPQADVANNGATNGGGISFSGVNNRFNSIFIDGAVNNDVFGLANSGTNGGQAGISPISPDALEQIQVVLAPYDVTLGGFAGGGINAVTRSGTNTFRGSAYYFNRNENLSGKTPTNDDSVERTKLAPFTARTYGARLGGPLIKNKLFFFTNVEIQRDEIPRPFIQSEYIGNATAADLAAVRSKLMSDFGYDPGGFENNLQTTDGTKFLLKLDWNINDKHKLSARHSYVKGTTEIHPAPSASRVVFEKVGYIFPSTTNSTALELKSIISPAAANNLIIGLTTVRDDRDILGDPFPQIILQDGAASIVVGTDNFSLSNVVNQDVLTITNNFNLYKGKHSWTFGTHNEFFKIENLFTIFSTPRYSYFFDGLTRFLDDEAPDLVLFGHEQSAADAPIRLGDEATNLGPSFNAMQLAFYGQDEIQVNRDLKLTVGLRFDIPIFTDDPPLNNTAFNTSTVSQLEQFYDLEGARASQAPKTQILWSPRIGFNYDVLGDKTTQLRGGIGIFTSRVPWVWPGGMFIRNGLNSAFSVGCCGGQSVFGEPQQWLDSLTSSASPAGDVDLFVEDFKYPQIFRASIAMDKKIFGNWDATAELTYTKTLNNMNVKQINIKPSDSNLSGADNRPVIDFEDKIDPTYENITLVSNTSEGYTFNATAQLSRQFGKGAFVSLAYSYTTASSLLDGRGFINNTNWLNVLSVQGNNNPSLSRSTFDAGSRITAFLSKKFDYGFAATTVSLFYTGKSGSPYSYTYNNPISDISSSVGYNDLLYVPESQGEINLIDIEDGASAAQQWSDLDAFISGDDYLSSRRGDYAEPNRLRTPFENILDLKIAQDFYVNTGETKHKLQITLDVFNFTNMISEGWGRRYFVGGNTFPLINANRNDEGVLEYTFQDPGDTFSIVQSGTYSARWTAQLGFRYEF